MHFSIPPTYPFCQNSPVLCIYFLFLSICTRWIVTIATISPGAGYLLQGAGNQGERTGTEQRWELTCLCAGMVRELQPCAPVRRVPQGAGHIAEASLCCLSQALDMPCVKGLQEGKKRVVLLLRPLAFSESRSNASALNPLQAMIAVNSNGEETQALPHRVPPWGWWMPPSPCPERT